MLYSLYIYIFFFEKGLNFFLKMKKKKKKNEKQARNEIFRRIPLTLMLFNSTYLKNIFIHITLNLNINKFHDITFEKLFYKYTQQSFILNAL